MNLNMRTLAVSILSSGIIAFGSTIAVAQNNADNTSAGESGHGTGCSNHLGGCAATQESSTFGSYRPTDANTGAGMSSGTTVNPGAVTAPQDSDPVSSCLPASEATPGHCISGGTNN